MRIGNIGPHHGLQVIQQRVENLQARASEASPANNAAEVQLPTVAEALGGVVDILKEIIQRLGSRHQDRPDNADVNADIPDDGGLGDDLGDVRTRPGEAAREAAKKLGAKGEAKGSDIHFGDRPNPGTAAHEAAHTIQQRGNARKGIGQKIREAVKSIIEEAKAQEKPADGKSSGKRVEVRGWDPAKKKAILGGVRHAVHELIDAAKTNEPVEDPSQPPPNTDEPLV